MEIKAPTHIPVTASLVIHVLLAWAIAQQALHLDAPPEPEPKVKVHLAVKPPPPPPASTPKTQPVKPAEPVAQQPVTPPQQVAPQKPVTPPVAMAQSKPVTARMSPAPVQPNVRPVMHAPIQTVQPKPTSATPIRHTTANTQHKTPLTPVPVQHAPKTVTPVTQTASIKTPVSTQPVTQMKTIQPQPSTVPDVLAETAVAPVQTAGLDLSFNKTVAPVTPVSLEPAEVSGPGPDLQKALDEFNNAIWGKILQAKYYPKMARIRRLEGQPVVKFTIEKDGSLSHISINNSSSHEILDSAALKTIQNAAPFPGIPEILNEERMVLEIPISFILNK